MRWPWVGRELHEDSMAIVREALAYERTRVDRLVDILVKMKRRHFESVEPRKPIAPADVDGDAVRRAEVKQLRRTEQTFIANATADLVRRGADPVAAEKEARRLYEQATDLHPEA